MALKAFLSSEDIYALLPTRIVLVVRVKQHKYGTVM